MASTYFQNIDFLTSGGLKVQWYIKEQTHFVKFGKKEIKRQDLHFVYEIDEVPDGKMVLLLSSVLQYIDDWEQVLREITKKFKPPYIIIERTPLGDKERIWVENVSEPIYDASYPCRVLTMSQIIRVLGNNYEIIDSWNSLVDGDIWTREGIVQFKSIVLKQRQFHE